MKSLILPFFLLFTLPILAQSPIPPNYYDSADGLSGTALKSALNDIVDGHIEYPYTSSSTDTWDILKETDRDPNNPDNVILIHTGVSVDGEDQINIFGGEWLREHVWAKSRGDFGTEEGAGTDVHALRPLDLSTNVARNNRWFNNCDDPHDNYGNFVCSNEYSWEPRDAVKGDVARMIFYMATRYEGENGELDLQLLDSIPTEDFTNDPVFAKLCTLIDWNIEDPVDAFEQNRNDVIYSYQGNRNPFIDNPNYATLIWGNQCGINLPVTLTDFQAYRKRNAIELKWTVSFSENVSHYEIQRSIDASSWRNLAEVNAINSTELSTYTYLDENPLPNSNYYRLKIVDEDGSYTYSTIQTANSLQAYELTVFPNPTTGFFRINLPLDNDVNGIVTVSNMLGQEVYNEDFASNSRLLQKDIELPQLPSGYYSLRVVVYDGRGSDDTVPLIIE